MTLEHYFNTYCGALIESPFKHGEGGITIERVYNRLNFKLCPYQLGYRPNISLKYFYHIFHCTTSVLNVVVKFCKNELFIVQVIFAKFR